MAKDLAASEIKAQMYKEALDTVKVMNITDEDFIIHNDKMRATRTKWIIPNRNKDLGKGKGVQYVPAFIAWRYVEMALKKIISEISQKDWDSKKDKYRDEERSKYEERNAIRTNNPKLREELVGKLFGGVVERYGGDDIMEPEPEISKANSRMNMKEYLSEIGLSNKLVEDSLIKDIS